jgi:hypothetical protein
MAMETEMEAEVVVVMTRMVETAETVKGIAETICKLGSRVDKWEQMVSYQLTLNAPDNSSHLNPTAPSGDSQQQ